MRKNSTASVCGHILPVETVQVWFNGIRFEQTDRYAWRGVLPKNYPVDISITYHGIDQPEDGRICQVDLREIRISTGHYRMIIDQFQFSRFEENDWKGNGLFVGFYRESVGVGLDVKRGGILLKGGFAVGFLEKNKELAA